MPSSAYYCRNDADLVFKIVRDNYVALQSRLDFEDFEIIYLMAAKSFTAKYCIMSTLVKQAQRNAKTSAQISTMY